MEDLNQAAEKYASECRTAGFTEYGNIKRAFFAGAEWATSDRQPNKKSLSERATLCVFYAIALTALLISILNA